MTGLILKDLYTLKKQWKMIALIAFVFIIFSFLSNDMTTFLSLTTVYVILLPLTSMAYDEQSKWDRYALAMPLSAQIIVLSKYVFAFLISLIQLIVALSVGLLLASQAGLEFKDTIVSVVVSSGVSLLMLAIILPLLYKFGVEKARLIMVMVFIIPALLAMLAVRMDLAISLEFLDNMDVLLPILLACALVIIIILSILISVRIYQKKEF